MRDQPSKPLTDLLFAGFLILHVVVGTLVPILAVGNIQLDVIEALAWVREWQAGYYKHMARRCAGARSRRGRDLDGGQARHPVRPPRRCAARRRFPGIEEMEPLILRARWLGGSTPVGVGWAIIPPRGAEAEPAAPDRAEPDTPR